MHRSDLRRPVPIVDYNSPDSQKAIEILRGKSIEFVEYDISKFETSCCGELSITIAPSVFAPEGFFKGLEWVVQYASSERKGDLPLEESESVYW
ncbi:thioredoxin domain-containing protein [Candidatus Nitrososphaera gargensis]|uniref:hypothetical protein n=1 Tax=Candidatus Nitrososphaera gargensis TaxID=497727 RepID=UPI0011E535DA|nr:hypothetical protein [Candidatus Nitrososphaera gargensis]